MANTYRDYQTIETRHVIERVACDGCGTALYSRPAELGAPKSGDHEPGYSVGVRLRIELDGDELEHEREIAAERARIDLGMVRWAAFVCLCRPCWEKLRDVLPKLRWPWREPHLGRLGG